MSLKSKKILGISVTTETKETILEYIEKYLEKLSEKPFIIVTPNPEQIVFAQNDKRFLEILNQADGAIPDGIGLALAMRVKRIPGVEFMEDLIRLAAKRGYGVGLIGGKDGVAVQALECLSRKHSGLKGWAEDPGELPIRPIRPITQSDQLIIEKIQKTNTRLVFVGLGAPKQEFFIEKLNAPVVAMAVGGAFNMIAGRTPRAPRAIGAFGLEWLWRLVHEPWRFRRQLALLKFLWLVTRSNARV